MSLVTYETFSREQLCTSQSAVRTTVAWPHLWRRDFSWGTDIITFLKATQVILFIKCAIYVYSAEDPIKVGVENKSKKESEDKYKI